VGLSVAGRLRRSVVLAGAGEGAALAGFGALTLSFAALVYAFVISDFSVMNVAANSHSEKPLLYRVSAAWGSHEGSMLLWNIALTGFGAVLASRGRALPRELKAPAVAVQGANGSVFLAYTVLASNPFVRLPNPPVEGQGQGPEPREGRALARTRQDDRTTQATGHGKPDLGEGQDQGQDQCEGAELDDHGVALASSPPRHSPWAFRASATCRGM
ncbi:MAG: hypothetical protein ACKOD3_11750, partial [Phenylobacterium sp.]